jgi:hypothetical protein
MGYTISGPMAYCLVIISCFLLPITHYLLPVFLFISEGVYRIEKRCLVGRIKTEKYPHYT